MKYIAISPIRRYMWVFFGCLFVASACGQPPAISGYCLNEAFDKKIDSSIGHTVPIMSIAQLNELQSEVILLDAREKAEYDTSHIKGARLVGYKNFDIKHLEGLPKDATLVVYCSIGVRSEHIGERLVELGYTRVFNLYGGVFEWANQGCALVGQQGQPVKVLHTYDWNWSRWVFSTEVRKVW